jgi:hypothetical protein
MRNLLFLGVLLGGNHNQQKLPLVRVLEIQFLKIIETFKQKARVDGCTLLEICEVNNIVD